MFLVGASTRTATSAWAGSAAGIDRARIMASLVLMASPSVSGLTGEFEDGQFAIHGNDNSRQIAGGDRWGEEKNGVRRRPPRGRFDESPCSWPFLEWHHLAVRSEQPNLEPFTFHTRFAHRLAHEH